MTYCPQCQTEVQTRNDYETGSLICMSCHGVLENNQMVSDVTFVESAGGRKGVVGQIVRTRGTGADEFDWTGREMLIQSVTEDMRAMGEQVNVRDADTLEYGMRVYKLALQRKFVRGRARDICVAVCLYVACRMQKRPVMIIDFSEILKKDLFLIGHTYLQLRSLLQLKIPIADPALYLERFASQLDYGEKFHMVVRTAAKLAARMNRDWMVQGRRPAGISAASLIISSRIHGFNRSIEDVMTVVRMSSGTIQKRLTEFAKTSVSKLTVEQFNVKAEFIKEEAEPPAYTEGKARRKRRLQKIKGRKLSKKEEHELEAKREEMEDDSATDDETVISRSDVLSPVDGELQEEMIKEADAEEIREPHQPSNPEDPSQQPREEEELIEIDDDAVDRVNALFDNDDIQELEEDFRPERDTSLYRHRFRFGDLPETEDWISSTEEVVQDESLSDDEEIEKMIVSDAQYRIKKRIWNELFGNIYREMKRKRRERDLLDETRDTKRKKRPVVNEEKIGVWDASGPMEAANEMLRRKVGGVRNSIFSDGLSFSDDLDGMVDEGEKSQFPPTQQSNGGIPGFDLLDESVSNKEDIFDF